MLEFRSFHAGKLIFSRIHHWESWSSIMLEVVRMIFSWFRLLQHEKIEKNSCMFQFLWVSRGFIQCLRDIGLSWPQRHHAWGCENESFAFQASAGWEIEKHSWIFQCLWFSSCLSELLTDIGLSWPHMHSCCGRTIKAIPYHACPCMENHPQIFFSVDLEKNLIKSYPWFEQLWANISQKVLTF